MDSQQEYAQFLAKFLKAAQDIRDGLSHLSPENQQRFREECNAVLKANGYTIIVSDLVQEERRSAYGRDYT